MQTVSALVVGTLLGLGMIKWAGGQGTDRSRYLFAAALVIAAAIYAAFSMNAGPAEWVVVELLGVALFTTTAVIGYRRYVLILGLAWIAHVGWDVWHELSEAVRFIPGWYPALCVGFDAVVGAHLLREWMRTDKTEAHKSPIARPKH